jgi:hypothetical protein
MASPMDMKGQEEVCPACGGKNKVPTPAFSPGRSLAYRFITVALILVAVISFFHSKRRVDPSPRGAKLSQTVGGIGKPQETTLASNLTSRIQVLKEESGREASWGYNVWILVPPITESEVKEIGSYFLSKMHQKRAIRLFVWLYYNKEDYDSYRWSGVNEFAFELYAHGPDFEICQIGDCPSEPTEPGCAAVFVKTINERGVNHPPHGKAYCEFDQESSTLTFNDAELARFAPQKVCMPLLVENALDMHIVGLHPWPYASVSV